VGLNERQEKTKGASTSEYIRPTLEQRKIEEL
jgi:hypothetical protein